MQIDTSFAALADPTRLGIVTRLAQTGEVDATELARPFAISQPAVSRHIKVLEDAGWVTRRSVGNRRPIRLNPEMIEQIHVWTGRLRATLAANYARLDALLEEEDSPK